MMSNPTEPTDQPDSVNVIAADRAMTELEAWIHLLEGQFNLRLVAVVEPLRAEIDRLRALTAEPKRDYTTETVVEFTVRPPLDEARWKALHDAALAAGAVHAHINPPKP